MKKNRLLFVILTVFLFAAIFAVAGCSGGGEEDQPIVYTVTYDSNKPIGASEAVAGETTDSSHTYDTAKALTQNGYLIKGWTFTGWNTEPDGNGTDYIDMQIVKDLTLE